MKKSIVINGSPNKDGLTAEKCAALGVPVVHLVDGIEKAVREVLSSDIVVFATPVHWFNVSVLMKQLIDTLPESPDFPCYGKTAYFLAVCEEDGGQQAVNQMFGPLNHMGFTVPPWASHFFNKNMAEKSENRWQVRGLLELKKILSEN